MKNNSWVLSVVALLIITGCTPEWEENGFPNEQSYTSAIDKGFDSLKDWESFSDGNFDNKEQWSNAMKAGFISKKEFLEAEKYNVNTKDSWLAENNQSKAGGFFSIENYFQAKELGISTQKELTKYEYDEVMLSGIKEAGKWSATYQQCADVSGNIFWHDLVDKENKKNKSYRHIFYNQLRGLFRSKDRYDWADANQNPFTKKQITAFNQAKNSENMGWDKELANMGAVYSGAELNGPLPKLDLEKLPQDNKMLNNYLETKCLKLIYPICRNAQARNSIVVKKQVNMSGETEKALVSVINYCSDVNRKGKAEFNHWNKYFEEEEAAKEESRNENARTLEAANKKLIEKRKQEMKTENLKGINLRSISAVVCDSHERTMYHVLTNWRPAGVPIGEARKSFRHETSFETRSVLLQMVQLIYKEPTNSKNALDVKLFFKHCVQAHRGY